MRFGEKECDGIDLVRKNVMGSTKNGTLLIQQSL